MPLPYGLGFFGDGPDTGSFAGDLTNFEKLMGATPSIFNVYMDFTQTPLPNTGSAAYDASSFDNSGLTKSAIPLVGMTLSSSADSTAANATFLEQLASSTQFDAQIEQFVNDWKSAGFDTVYWRPVVEMNLTSTPGFAVWQSNPSILINAFQKAYTLLHAASKAAGMGCVVIWNPGCSNSSPAGLATETLYPGDGFVDQIGGDIYDDLWPMSGTAAQIEASPASLEAYYNNPAEGGSTASCLSLDVLAAFALAHKKPLCIPETGCGAAPSDNPTFPAWLRAKLDSWVAKGLEVSFVSIWSNGVYNFLNGSKPNEAAAWAANFGVDAPAIAATTSVTPPATPTASFTVSKAGTLVVGTEGTITDTAGTQWGINSGKQITFTKLGGSLEVEGTSADVDQLYWDGADLDQLNGSGDWWTQPLAGGGGTKLTAPPKGYAAPTTPPTVISTTALPQSSFDLYLSGDQYQGPPEAEITVDGHVVATNLPVPAVHGSGQWMGFTFQGNYGAGQHTVAVTFLNDLYDGTPQTDRNLWFGVLVVDGQTYGEATEIPSTGNNVTLTVTTLH